jgi:outer membrane immunogenic protein
MRKFLLGAALIASASATPVFAQDEAPVQAPFTGAHVEGLIGYDDVSDAKANLLYGVAGGFDFQTGGAIIGIEGEFADSDVKATEDNLFTPGDRFRLNTDRDLYIGARIGYAVAPATLLYVKGGYTNARFEGAFDTGTGTSYNNGVTADGYRVGAGVEQKFNLFGPSGFVKAEYRYSNYRNIDIGEDDFDRKTDFDRHQFLAGVGVRF